jgi:very-short-patch-repair endonuclease
MDSNRLASIASRQSGLFTSRQAQACGFSRHQILRRVRTGVWRRISSSVFGLAGVAVTVAVRDRAAQLAVPGSVLAGPSAARRWGLDVPDDRICLIVGAHASPRRPGLLILHEPLDSCDLQSVEGVPVTSRARTVVDCLRVLPERPAIELLDRALQRRWITVADLARRVQGHFGRRGARRLVRLLGLATSGTRSAAERLAAQLLRQSGIGGWVANVPIRDGHGLIGVGDIVFSRLKLVIEIDGRAFHVSPEQFQTDRERQNRLVAAGWTVLRFTWRDLTERPAYVIGTIRAMLAEISAGAH